MPTIEIGPDLIHIDAEIVAKALKLTPQDLQARMRAGTVTSRSEHGEGDDKGRIRLTFFSASRRARIIADMTGTVLTCSGADFSRPLMTASGSEQVAASSVPDRHKLDAMLDDALDQTFPASDPIALSLNFKN